MYQSLYLDKLTKLYPTEEHYTVYGISYVEQTATAIQERLDEEVTYCASTSRPFSLNSVVHDSRTEGKSTLPVLYFQYDQGSSYTLREGDILLWWEDKVGNSKYSAMPADAVAMCLTMDGPKCIEKKTCIQTLREDILASFPDYTAFKELNPYKFIDVLEPWCDTNHEGKVVMHLYLDKTPYLDISDLGILICSLPTFSTKYNAKMKYVLHFWADKTSTTIVDKPFLVKVYRQLSKLPQYTLDLVEDIVVGDNKTNLGICLYNSLLWDDLDMGLFEGLRFL